MQVFIALHFFFHDITYHCSKLQTELLETKITNNGWNSLPSIYYVKRAKKLVVFSANWFKSPESCPTAPFYPCPDQFGSYWFGFSGYLRMPPVYDTSFKQSQPDLLRENTKMRCDCDQFLCVHFVVSYLKSLCAL